MSDDLVKRLDSFDADDLHRELAAESGDWRTDLAADRIEELEAKLAKAVEALESAQESIATFIGVHGYPEESGVFDVLNQVSTTLAELNASDDR